MPNKIFFSLIAIFFLSGLKPCFSSVLTQEQVIKSAQQHYPKILAYYDAIEAASASVLEAEGFFDVKLKQELLNKSRGYYDGSLTNTTVSKRLKFLNGEVYSGYKRSYGSFPLNEYANYTNDKGEFNAGAKFSLLRNSSIDEQRLNLSIAKLRLEENKIQLEKITMQMRQDASKAYWGFVASGLIFKVYEDLYKMALERNTQLETRFKKGDIAKILLTENKRNILHRKSSMIKARQDFENNALYLSLFWRDENGDPKIANIEMLPKLDFAKRNAHFEKVNLEEDMRHALENRAEARVIKNKIAQEQNNLLQAKNLLNPQLDVDLKASKDYGNGPLSRSQSNNAIKIDFETPLQRNQAKGKISATTAKISAIKFEEKLLLEQIKTELKQLKNSLDAITEINQIVNEEIELSKTLEDAEKQRFWQGGSNFFLINLREQESASAQIAALEILEKYQKTIAEYKAAAFLQK